MKKLKAFLASAVAGSILGAAGAQQPDLPGFDFAYEIGGTTEAAPVQIFDDGLFTYIQWPNNSLKSGTRISVRIDGKEPPPISGPTPRLKLKGVGSVIDLQVGAAKARAMYVGIRGRAPMQRAVADKPALAERSAIRDAEQRRLEGEGHYMRVYVPFGEEWYGYFVRRIAERPANMTFFLRALLSRG